MSSLLARFLDAATQLADRDAALSDADLRSVISAFNTVATDVHARRLFSENEDWDDAATSSLPYLLVDALLADAWSRARTPSPSARAHAVRTAVKHYDAYLRTYDRLLGISSATAADLPQPGAGAGAFRDAKIARFKAQRAREQTLATMQHQLVAAASRRAARSASRGLAGAAAPVLPPAFLASVTSGFSSPSVTSTAAARRSSGDSDSDDDDDDTTSHGQGTNKGKDDNNDNDNDDDDDDDDDEELVSRDFVRLLLIHHAARATDELSMLRDELTMVQHMADVEQRQQGDDAAMARGGAASAAEAADPRTRAAEAAALAQRLDGVQLGRTPTTGPLLDRQGRPMRPFTIVSQRAVEQDRVFRPSHRLPTMSIEEYLDAEVARGGILPKQDDTPKVESDSDDEEVADRHTYKKRAWDAFTDDNKRGAGNRNWNRG